MRLIITLIVFQCGRGQGRRLLRGRGLRVLGRLLVRLLLRGSNGGPLRSRRLLCHLFRVLLGLDLLRQLLGHLLGLEGLVVEDRWDGHSDVELLVASAELTPLYKS